MFEIHFLTVASHRGGAGESRKRGSSDETTPSRSFRRRSSSDILINEDVDGLSGTDINGASSLGTIHLDFIPEWLILNILIRLPSKFVVRCKLVSKQWASLISGPFFVRSYLSHSSSSISSWVVIEEVMRKDYLGNLTYIDYGVPKDTCSRQNFGSIYPPCAQEYSWDQRYRVFGTSSGLILFGVIPYVCNWPYNTCDIFYVGSPMTRKSILLSPVPHRFLTRLEWLGGSGFVTRVKNGVLESFRVVLLMRDTDAGCLRFSVYASETREWGNEFVFYSHHVILAKRPTALKETLHWETRDGSIIAYDPYEKPGEVRVIAPPEDIDARDPEDRQVRFRCLIDASGGKLRYFERSTVLVNEGDPAVRLRLWDYCSGMWSLSHKSDDTSIQFNDFTLTAPVLSSLTPKFFHPLNSDILYLNILNCLLTYNFSSRRFELVQMAARMEPIAVQLPPWPQSFEDNV